MVCQYAFSIRNVYFKGLYFRVWDVLARNYESPLNINILYCYYYYYFIMASGGSIPMFLDRRN